MGEVLTFINNNVSGDILSVDSARQIGGTTMLMAGILHQLIFNPNNNYWIYWLSNRYVRIF